MTTVKTNTPHRRESGMTLVELMVVVAIIGILASIAYPSYTDYVIRAKRSDAQALMMENAQFLERYFTSNGTYVGAVPVPNTKSPKNGTQVDYNIVVTTPLATTYLIQATPVVTEPKCGTLTLDQTGLKDRIGGTSSVGECWRD